MKAKSTCRALFSALTMDSAQCCDSMIHLAIRVGAQPFPRRKSINLNVSVSPVGFFQKIRRMSFGQRFSGKNASPSMTLTNCLLSSTTSDLDKSAISSRYSFKVAIMLRRENGSFCTWDKFGDILANSGARSFGLFDELVSFFTTMNMNSSAKMQVSDAKEYQDFLQMFTGKTKTRETITGNANYRMNQTSFTLMGFTQPQTALPIIQDDQNNSKGFTSRLLWFFPQPVFCRLKDTVLSEEESRKLKQFKNELVEFLAELYTEGETTYTIEEGDRVTKVIVDRLQFDLSTEAHNQFELIHDEWELSVCEKYPHDAFVGGLYSRGKSQILRLAVPVQLLLSFWETAELKLQVPVDSLDTEEELPLKSLSNEDSSQVTGETSDDDDHDTQEQDGPSHIIGPEAVQIACSLVGTCLTQLCALNGKMHVTRCLEGEIDNDSSSTSEVQSSINIAAFGKLYSAILLTHGEVVSMPLLNQKGIFRRCCNGISGSHSCLRFWKI